MRTLVGLVAITFVVGCGDDGGKGAGDDGPDDAAASDGSSVDAPIDGQMIDAMIDAPTGTTPLTVKNYLDWCSFSIDGAPSMPGAMRTANVTPGVITLVATRKNATFQVNGNMWHHTDGDTGTGEPGVIANANDPALKSSTAMVTVGASAACVWVCCPFANDGSGCGSTIPDQCP